MAVIVIVMMLVHRLRAREARQMPVRTTGGMAMNPRAMAVAHGVGV